MENQFNPFTLVGKTIVITGASSGIGAQCAISCSKMGARLILIGRNKERLNKTLEQTINKENHFPVLLDLTDLSKVSDVIQKTVDEVGPINGLINCAGVSTTLPLRSMSADKIHSYFDNNVLSALYLTKEITKSNRFSKSGGSIIFISSVMGSVGESGKSLYSMTKGALLSSSRSLACEFAKKNIRFNTISPGAILTPINENLPHMTDPEKRKILEEKHLLGLGTTEDVANACIYLLSDASKWVTGTNLIVDGGYTAI